MDCYLHLIIILLKHINVKAVIKFFYLLMTFIYVVIAWKVTCVIYIVCAAEILQQVFHEGYLLRLLILKRGLCRI